MARIRSVKPALRTSQVVARWPFAVRYFWVLLWGYLDDKGRGLDIVKTIAGDCFPHDPSVTPGVINKWLTLMATTKVEPDRDPPLCRYEVAGTRYLHSVYWDEHQKPNRPSPSQHPPCPVHERLTESSSEPLSESPLSPQVLEFEGLTEGEVERPASEPLTEPSATQPPPGPGPEPTRKCQEHRDDPDPPSCRRCATLREANEAWRAERRTRAATAPKCARHRGQPAANCALCRSEDLARRRQLTPDVPAFVEPTTPPAEEPA